MPELAIVLLIVAFAVAWALVDDEDDDLGGPGRTLAPDQRKVDGPLHRHRRLRGRGAVRMKLYLGGPMSGLPAFNFPAFDRAAGLLRSAGHIVVSPAELDGPDRTWIMESPDGVLPEGREWGDFLSRDVGIIVDPQIEAVAVLDGWHESKGANLEVVVARSLGKPIFRVASGRPEAGYVEAIELGELDHLSLNASSGTGEVRVTNANTGGAKGSKEQRFDLLPWDALSDVSEVYSFGARKYEPDNWRRGYAWSLSFAAMQRHVAAFWMREDNDAESGLHHMAHATFHALALLVFVANRRYAALDDRPNTAPSATELRHGPS